MKKQNLTSSQVELMFYRASENILKKVDYLNQLDSETGDGDHGTTMQRAMHAVDSVLKKQTTADPAELFQKIGWEIMCQDGGSAGMLFGNFLIGIGEAINSQQPDATNFAFAFSSGLDRLIKSSGALVGEKTMIDALAPAAQAMQKIDNQAGFSELLKAAAKAAKQGAEQTKDMRPTRGRAKHMGEKAIGHLDPGACSMAILVESFYQAFI